MLGVVALLGGCAVQPSIPPAGTQFDGTYVGHSELLRGGGYVCGIADLPARLVIRDGRFAYPFQAAPPAAPAPLDIQVRANGTFRHVERYFAVDFRSDRPVQPLVTVIGSIEGGTLVATEDDLRCTRRSVLSRVGPG